MQTIFMFVGLLTLVFSGVSDAQSVDAGFNDTRCSDGRVVCPNDPLLYTCTIINSGSGIATVTLPSGPGIQIDDENQTSVVGAVSLPAGVKLQFYDARISDGKVNYTISLALERADLINNSMVSCDTHAAGSTPILKNCVFTMDPPGPPEGLRQNVSANTESSVVAEWRSPGSTGGNGINISDYTVSTSGVRSETVSGDGRNISHNITGLDYNTSYTVSVTAINSCGLSSSSSVANIQTKIKISVPPLPTLLSPLLNCEHDLSTGEDRPVAIHWLYGEREGGVVYPGEERIQLMVDGSTSCPRLTTADAAICSFFVSRDGNFTVSLILSNDAGSVSTNATFDSNPLQVVEREGGGGPAVVVTLNSLCTNSVPYTVELSFGVREGEKCVPQWNRTAVLFPGTVVIYPTVDYCLSQLSLLHKNNENVSNDNTTRIEENGKEGEGEEGRKEKEGEGEEGGGGGGGEEKVSTLVIVITTVMSTLVVSLPVGVVIGWLCLGRIAWWRRRESKEQENTADLGGESERETMKESVYSIPVVNNAVIAVAANQAYGHVQYRTQRL